MGLGLSYLRSLARNGARLFSYWLFRREFEDSVVAWQPDIIHAHDAMALPMAARAAQKAGATLIFDSHELETHRNPPQPWLNRVQARAVEGKYLSRAARVITVSEKIALHLEAEYAIARPEVIYNTPPLGPWPVPQKWQQGTRIDVRAETGLEQGRPLLVYTGNVAVNRGIEETIEGLAHYNKTYPQAPQVHLSLVGRATPQTQAALLRLAEQKGVTDQLQFHDPVAANDVVRFISTASFAVIPIIPETLSYDYAMPNKLFEAALAGLPILGSDLAEMGPFIREHALGQTYDSRSPDAFSTALTSLMGTQENLSRPETGFAQRFSWEGQAEKLLALYRAL